MKQAICPLCNKPCGDYLPGAVKYHWECLEAKFKPLREQWAKEREIERQRRGYGPSKMG
jgi:hypothetical protein